MLVVPLLTSLTQGWAMGWASCPYDPMWAERYPRRAGVMAAAGPAGNLLIALVAFVTLRVGLGMGWFVAPNDVSLASIAAVASSGMPSYLTTALSVLLVMNVFLCVFNLLPLPPLDGSAVLALFLSDHQANRVREFQSGGMMSMLGLLIAWQVFPLVTDPLFSVVLRLVYPNENYF